jgi:hypothetical protein
MTRGAMISIALLALIALLLIMLLGRHGMAGTIDKHSALDNRSLDEFEAISEKFAGVTSPPEASITEIRY